MSRRLALPDPILVVGGSGYRNVGDEAILAGLLAELGDCRVTVVSRAPADTAAMHGVRAVRIADAVSALRRHRSVLIGGGGLFGADMGALGRMLPGFGLLASALGREVALVGIGLDPQLAAAPLVRRLARRASLVRVRDRGSADVLASWGVVADVGPDLSEAMAPAPPAAGAALLRAAGVRLGRPVVGLSLTALAPSMTSEVLDAVLGAIAGLPETQFCVIPMSHHPFVNRHNDLLLGRRLRERHPRVAILDGSHHPASILAAVGHMGALVGMRYHSLLFADRLGVPLVPISYAPKTAGWLADHGMASIDPTAEALAEALRLALAAAGPQPAARRAAS
jgi:polysaccharide pyruvyl transferase WcaK-like protein